MTTATADTPDRPELIDGRYSIVSEPARFGGMSTVNKAFDIQKSRFVAIKRMKLSAPDEMRWKESFHREYSALRDLSAHANIVEMHDAGQDDYGNYIVLEWVETNLYEYIEQNGPMTWGTYYSRIGRPVLEALVFAQNQSWNHRDLKPQNILITDDGDPRISDYGIAKQFDRPSIGLTFSGFRSAPFTPPEDDLPQHACSRDGFSWAAVTIFCLSGKVAPDYGSQEALLKDLSSDAVPIEILLTALSNDPAERPPLVSGLLADLDEWFRANAKAVSARPTYHLEIDGHLAKRLQGNLDISDRADLQRALADELNEIDVGVRRTDGPSENTSLRIYAVTWIFEARFSASSSALTIFKAWQSRSADIERQRERSYRPNAAFSFAPPERRQDPSHLLDELLLQIDAFEQEEKSRALEAERQRIFKVWYAFLRAKADFESRRENAISFINRRVDGNTVIFVTDLPASLELIGQSRIVRLSSGHHVFCDVIDVNLEEVVATVTGGDPVRLPKQGRIEVNTVAAEKAIDRQRWALDAVNYNRTPNPRLKSVISEPAENREPSIMTPPVPIAGGKFDPEKLEILKRALGNQDVLAIQGPPGTGKTRLIEEILIQYLALHPTHRVLLSAQTHVALDNVLDRLRVRHPSIDIVRIGRPDDHKISASSKDLVLDRKAQSWSDAVIAQSTAFLKKWADDRGVDRTSTEIGLLVNRLRLLLQHERDLARSIRYADDRLNTVREEEEQKLAKTGSADSSELEETGIEAQQAATVLRKSASRVKDAIAEVRERIESLDSIGKELSTQENDDDLKEWSAMLLGAGGEQSQLVALLELHEEWVLRVGKSSDFHAAMLASAQVVAGTCIGMAGIKGMAEVAYDLCIIDEASKATATEILVPMSRSRKWILVGDPEQLPPFFESDAVTKLDDFDEEEVRETLLDRFLERLPAGSIRHLRNQHRMVKPIGDLISESFYKSMLTSPREKAEVVLTGLFPKPVTWMSTTQLNDRREESVGRSFKNESECRIVRDTLERIDFIARKRKAIYSIALIAGYGAQVKALQDQIRDRLHEWTGLNVMCSTVDAFQGSEAEICIYSVTRSNSDGRLGFLTEKPRLNVALSRGRSALIIVGDESFCREADGDNPFRPVLSFIERNADVCERRDVL